MRSETAIRNFVLSKRYHVLYLLGGTQLRKKSFLVKQKRKISASISITPLLVAPFGSKSSKRVRIRQTQQFIKEFSRNMTA